jgi:hypothetical protein
MANRNGTLAALLLAAALACRPALAAEQPCAADARKLCAGIPAGDGRIFYCLKSNWNGLSDGCRETIDWAARRAREVGLDCQADAFAYCQGVPAGKGRLFACLASHREKVSSQCQDALARVEHFTSSCSGDAARLCPGLPAGQGAVLACLLTQRDRLSDACRLVFWP